MMHFRVKQSKVVVMLLLSMLSLALQADDTVPANNENLPIASIRLFTDVFDRIKRSGVVEVTDNQLFEYAISGMLERIDPYSELLSIDKYRELLALTDGEIAHVGIKIADAPSAEGFALVQTVLSRSSAAKAGVKAGDSVVLMDGKDLKGFAPKDVQQSLHGVAGTSVKLGIRHAQEKKMLTVQMLRNTLDDKSVLLKELNDKVYLLTISSFQQKTPDQLDVVLTQLRAYQPKGLVIDLRNNLGGVVTSAVTAADYFLTKGLLISQSHGRGEPAQQYVSQLEPILPDLPVVILINKNTASAAEVFAAALQDNGRAVIVGEHSRGKASIQKVVQLDDAHGLKLTVATYQTPLGKNISGLGITPNIVLTKVADSTGLADKDTAIEQAVVAIQAIMQLKATP